MTEKERILIDKVVCNPKCNGAETIELFRQGGADPEFFRGCALALCHPEHAFPADQDSRGRTRNPAFPKRLPFGQAHGRRGSPVATCRKDLARRPRLQESDQRFEGHARRGTDHWHHLLFLPYTQGDPAQLPGRLSGSKAYHTQPLHERTYGDAAQKGSGFRASLQATGRI